MLAEHIKAELPHLHNIVSVALGTCGGVDAVAVISLIEQTVEEIRLAVKADKCFAVFLFNAYRAKREIAFDSVLARDYLYLVKIGVFGSPEQRLGDVYPCTLAFKVERDLAARSAYLHALLIHAAAHLKQNAAKVGGKSQSRNIILRHSFKPNRLPYTARGGVPHSASLVRLLAVCKLDVKRVLYLNCELILALGEIGSNIKFKRQISALVLAYEAIVEINVGYLIYRAEVEQHGLFVKVLREREALFVKVSLACSKRPFYTRERAFGREGYFYLAECFGALRVVFYGESPLAAERQKEVALELRSRVNAPILLAIRERS